jgi:hypothetical protein
LIGIIKRCPSIILLADIDPPADNRWRFATAFDKKEVGNVIVDRCRQYLAALNQMVKEWENQPPSL